MMSEVRMEPMTIEDYDDGEDEEEGVMMSGHSG